MDCAQRLRKRLFDTTTTPNLDAEGDVFVVESSSPAEAAALSSSLGVVSLDLCISTTSVIASVADKLTDSLARCECGG